jgi:serine/threonine protein phosphatase PrpC
LPRNEDSDVLKSPLEISGESRALRRHRLDCASLSAPGKGRAVNEDHCLFVAPGMEAAEQAGAGYLFAVIDGNAHGGQGRRAARETATSILEILDDDRRSVLRPDLLSFRLQDANDRVTNFIRGRCAVTAVWIWEEGEELQAAWAHVGDTRLYRHNGRDWRQLTRDHARGRLLNRAIGGGPDLGLETGRLVLRPEDRLALLTDGAWRCAPPTSVLSAAPLPTAADAVRRLIGQARLNGPGNDTSAIVITVRDAAAAPEPEH